MALVIRTGLGSLGSADACAFVAETMATAREAGETLVAQQASLVTSDAGGTSTSTSSGPSVDEIDGAMVKGGSGGTVDLTDGALTQESAASPVMPDSTTSGGAGGGVNVTEIPAAAPEASAAHGGVGVAVAGILLGGFFLWTVFRR